MLPPGTPEWLAGISLRADEKLNPRERADLLKVFELPKNEADELKKLEAQCEEAGIGAEIGEGNAAVACL